MVDLKVPLEQGSVSADRRVDVPGSPLQVTAAYKVPEGYAVKGELHYCEYDPTTREVLVSIRHRGA